MFSAGYVILLLVAVGYHVLAIKYENTVSSFFENIDEIASKPHHSRKVTFEDEYFTFISDKMDDYLETTNGFIEGLQLDPLNIKFLKGRFEYKHEINAAFPCGIMYQALRSLAPTSAVVRASDTLEKFSAAGKDADKKNCGKLLDLVDLGYLRIRFTGSISVFEVSNVSGIFQMLLFDKVTKNGAEDRFETCLSEKGLAKEIPINEHDPCNAYAKLKDCVPNGFQSIELNSNLNAVLDNADLPPETRKHCKVLRRFMKMGIIQPKFRDGVFEPVINMAYVHTEIIKDGNGLDQKMIVFLCLKEVDSDIRFRRDASAKYKIENGSHPCNIVENVSRCIYERDELSQATMADSEQEEAEDETQFEQLVGQETSSFQHGVMPKTLSGYMLELFDVTGGNIANQRHLFSCMKLNRLVTENLLQYAETGLPVFTINDSFELYKNLGYVLSEYGDVSPAGYPSFSDVIEAINKAVIANELRQSYPCNIYNELRKHLAEIPFLHKRVFNVMGKIEEVIETNDPVIKQADKRQCVLLRLWFDLEYVSISNADEKTIFNIVNPVGVFETLLVLGDAKSSELPKFEECIQEGMKQAKFAYTSDNETVCEVVDKVKECVPKEGKNIQIDEEIQLNNIPGEGQTQCEDLKRYQNGMMVYMNGKQPRVNMMQVLLLTFDTKIKVPTGSRISTFLCLMNIKYSDDPLLPCAISQDISNCLREFAQYIQQEGGN